MKTSELRKEARETLKGKWVKAICITLAFMAITFAIGYIQGLVGKENPLYDIIDLAYAIISIPLSFGLLVCFIKLKRGEEVNAFDFFKEGFSRFGKSWGITLHTLLRLILPYICLFITGFPLLLIFILNFFYLFVDAEAFGYYIDLSTIEQLPYILPILIILFILAIIYMIRKSLLYVFAYNISYDNPELTSKECVLKSAELMKRNRRNYFMLELSFIGWAILALCTFGIGMLWLTPYMQIATVCFYERIAKVETKNAESAEKVEE